MYEYIIRSCILYIDMVYKMQTSVEIEVAGRKSFFVEDLHRNRFQRTIEIDRCSGVSTKIEINFKNHG